jgi:hypothetical protein
MTTRSSLRKLERAAVLSAATLLLVACGGEDKGRPSGEVVEVPPVDQCALANEYEFQPIVTFEPRQSPSGGTNRYAYCEAAVPCEAVAPAPFYFNYDKARTEDASGAPPGVSCPVPSDPATVNISKHDVITEGPREIYGQALPDGTRCGTSANALNFTATNLAMCVGFNGRLGWGAGLDLNFQKPNLFDASDWDGISFWVRRSGEGGSAFVFSVVDSQNEGVTADFEQETSPGCGCYRPNPVAAPTRWQCSNDPGPEYPDVVKCDAYGAEVSITDQWTFYAFEFSGLRQKGFGFASQPFDKSKLSRLQFLVQFGNWSFWLDDIALFRKKQ